MSTITAGIVEREEGTKKENDSKKKKRERENDSFFIKTFDSRKVEIRISEEEKGSREEERPTLGRSSIIIHQALAGVAQRIEHWPANQKASSSIPSQGTCLGCQPDPQWEVHKRQPHIDVSLLLFPFPSL